MPRIPTNSGCTTWNEWLALPEEKKVQIREDARRRRNESNRRWRDANPEKMKEISRNNYMMIKEAKQKLKIAESSEKTVTITFNIKTTETFIKTKFIVSTTVALEFLYNGNVIEYDDGVIHKTLKKVDDIYVYTTGLINIDQQKHMKIYFHIDDPCIVDFIAHVKKITLKL